MTVRARRFVLLFNLKNFIIMKFEKINLDKFAACAQNELTSPNLVYGGYPGETSTSTQSDQIKGNGSVDYTDHGSGTRNDGFSATSIRGGIAAPAYGAYGA